MPNMQERLETAVSQAETDVGLMHDVVHGDDTVTVPTEGGDVPSLAKVIKDVRDSITTGTNDLVSIAQEAATTATEKAEICTTLTASVTEMTETTTRKAEMARIFAEGTDEEIAAYGGKHSCRNWVEMARTTTIGSYPITTMGVAMENQVNLPLDTAVEVLEQVLTVVVENTILLPETYSLSADGKAVTLKNPLALGDRWSIKCLHDLQSISSPIKSVLYEDMEAE